ncbi:hypothetical protein ATEIFO6365_0012021600 [Aspergillus terreus]|uniref:Uncharacterized protein n=1 Tax=Aspergillus terreus TaxID=33178 RepID=A0A5M3ZEB7_ASPTE|nr:hypothetical protein ATETN484_0013022600 [Aspergillus terreus]GFF20460.1 hypothetical protein ATEIFO6365_0012021600 [Aspergillus terreus]
MPRRPTPAEKQRVRTGCLTCRRRRRKCDEGKPRCANCEVKGFVCKYRTDLAFVSPQSARDTPATTRQYSTITFVDDSPAAAKGNQCLREHSGSANPVDLAEGDVVDPPSDTVLHDASGTPTAPLGRYHDSLSLRRGPDPSQGGRYAIQGRLDVASGSQPSQRGQVPENSNAEIDILRHFRYHVGPWIDLADPDCALGVQTLLLSRTHRLLQAAILALSSSQRALLAQSQRDEDTVRSRHFRKAAEEILVFPGLTGQAGQALLLIQELLPLGLRQWRDHLTPQLGPFGKTLPSPTALSEALGDAVFWFLFRLDIASSIATKAGRSESTSFPTLQQSQFLSQWTFLWTDCQKWYSERPIDAQQIVDIRSEEADQIDPGQNSSFPILIYPTPMALAANAVYHVTSFLLLTHKPRLLKALPGPRYLTSHIWHAQCIAGIAASNDSPEQWDPVFVASILLVARGMTHVSQHTVLLDRLRRITTTTGINLTREIEELQSVWRVARYDAEWDEQDCI